MIESLCKVKPSNLTIFESAALYEIYELVVKAATEHKVNADEYEIEISIKPKKPENLSTQKVQAPKR